MHRKAKAKAATKPMRSPGHEVELKLEPAEATPGNGAWVGAEEDTTEELVRIRVLTRLL